MTNCKHCGNEVSQRIRLEHWPQGYGHEFLCCDCMDLSCGQPLEDINAERVRRGAAPITKPWPPKFDFNEFKETVMDYLATDEHNRRVLAIKFEVQLGEPARWARGVSRPHPLLGRQVLDFIALDTVVKNV